MTRVISRVLGIITARGGSKRIPGKNICQVGGKTLIEHTIDAAQQSQFLTRVVVSTDSPEIAAVAERSGAEVPELRPAGLAADDTTSEAVVLDLIARFSGQGEEFDTICLLQPTSPLRSAEHLDQAFNAYIENQGAEAVVGVRRLGIKPSWIKRVDGNGYLQSALDPGQWPQAPLYVTNGAIYIISTEALLRHRTFLPPCTLPWVMDAMSSIDIDEPEDLELARTVLRGRELSF